MAALTLSTTTVQDGNTAPVTVQNYVDPNNAGAKGAVVAVIMGDGSILTLGQALAAASVPVVLPASQVAALTPPTSVGVTGTVGVSNFPAGFGATVTNFPATQPVSAAALPLPTGASTEATLAALSAKVPAQGQALAAASVPVVLTASQMTALTPVAGLTDAQLRATAVPVASALLAGTAVVGKVGIDQTTPGVTNGVQIVPGTAGGWTPSRVKTAATTNATSVKASPGQIGGYALFNGSAATRFVKFYDLATAPTVGTSTPLFTVILPAGAGANVCFPGGIQCAAGIAWDCTAGVADADATATAADDVHGTILFK